MIANHAEGARNSMICHRVMHLKELELAIEDNNGTKKTLRNKKNLGSNASGPPSTVEQRNIILQ